VAALERHASKIGCVLGLAQFR